MQNCELKKKYSLVGSKNQCLDIFIYIDKGASAKIYLSPTRRCSAILQIAQQKQTAFY